jgi:hypothetical protein
MTRKAITRREDWPERLAASIEAQAGKTFRWGKHDCTTAWSDHCKAMTGADPMAEFRGQYHDAASASAALKEIGAGSLYHTMARKFGKPAAPAMARRGDPVLAVTALGPTLLTCIGAECVGPGAEGPIRLPTTGARFAWRVG